MVTDFKYWVYFEDFNGIDNLFCLLCKKHIENSLMAICK